MIECGARKISLHWRTDWPPESSRGGLPGAPASTTINTRRNTISTSLRPRRKSITTQKRYTSVRAIWEKRDKRKTKECRLPEIERQNNCASATGRNSRCKSRRYRGLSATKKILMPCDSSNRNPLPTAKKLSSVSGVHLSEEVLGSRREERLARVKQECDSERRKIKRKQEMIARLKARQKNWVNNRH